MKNIFLFSIAVFLFSPLLATAEVRSSLKIGVDGKVVAENISVFQIAGTTVYGRATWGDITIRMTILTNEKTKIIKEYGGVTKVSEFKEGDRLHVEGTLPPLSDTLNIQATYVKNSSLLKEEKEVSGTVTDSTNLPNSFVVTTQKKNKIVVSLKSGAIVKKGERYISPGEIANGDKILSVKGTFDYGAYSIEATEISVFQENIFKPRNFSGILKGIQGVSLPTVATINTEGKDYTVLIPATAKIFNKAKQEISLTRFQIGDSVRFYGSIKKTDLSTIERVEVLKNTSF